jgi:hypothetical protein
MRPHAQSVRQSVRSVLPSAQPSVQAFSTHGRRSGLYFPFSSSQLPPRSSVQPALAPRSHERRPFLQFVPFSRAFSASACAALGGLRWGSRGAGQTCRMIPSVLGARCAAACSAGRRGVMAAAGAPVISAIGSSARLSLTSNATPEGRQLSPGPKWHTSAAPAARANRALAFSAPYRAAISPGGST